MELREPHERAGFARMAAIVLAAKRAPTMMV